MRLGIPGFHPVPMEVQRRKSRQNAAPGNQERRMGNSHAHSSRNPSQNGWYRLDEGHLS